MDLLYTHGTDRVEKKTQATYSQSAGNSQNWLFNWLTKR